MGTSDPLATGDKHMARVAVKPAPFCRSNPNLCFFFQLDAQFKLGCITRDDTKFYTAISALHTEREVQGTEVLQSVREIVLKPPTDNKYEELKNKLISVYEESENTKLKQLLQDLQLCDMRPSQLLSKMQELSGDNFKSNVLQSLWLNRLPNNIQAILASSNENLPQLAQMADKIHDVLQPQAISQVQHPSVDISSLQQQIQELSLQVAALQTRSQYHPRGRSKSRNRNNREYQRAHSGTQSDICFYHSRFGDKARKCTPPCKFQKTSLN
ncbi:uncharacterized protein LOC118180671 [Stegodyphus dumicola]|uniref:uncharacterized protein LOC118180671 n=1 Tax=Stegodyphus dumicola TaxID=202533 RepID=UPI0015B3772A|nr:uncharacterized protein LOC118180671 [Stegodyphus dumicola]